MPDMEEKVNKMDYETTMAALQGIIEKLEAQGQSLEASIKLFEEGQLLIKHCSRLLANAELKVQTLLAEQGTVPGDLD